MYGSAEGDLAAVLEAAGVPTDPELVRELNQTRMKAFAENGVHLWEDSIPTLRALRARGAPDGDREQLRPRHSPDRGRARAGA